ncbi:MAG: HIRAN domain-containing protein [Pseudoclavibacter sp.]
MSEQARGPRTDHDSIYLHSSRWDDLLTSADKLRIRPHGGEWWLYEVTTRKLVNVGCRNLLALELFTAQLRGLQYYQEKRADTRPGGSATLVREPDNEHDPFAVAVLSRGVKVGYVPKMMARRVAKRLDHGEDLEAIFIAGASAGTEASRVRVIVATPELMALLRSDPPALPRRTSVRTTEPARVAPLAVQADSLWTRFKRAFLGS